MTIYKCDKCNKEFDKKSTFAYHSVRINSCVKDTNINNEFYCNKIFSLKHNLTAHLKTCKKKKLIDTNQSQIDELKKIFENKFEEQLKKFEEQQKINQELEKKVEQLTHLTESNHITVTENSNNNNNNNIINIFSAGKEDLTRLSKEEIIKICTSGTYYPLVAAEIIHCNEKYPEFQNFLISNLRSDVGHVLINDKWVTKPQDEILSTLLKVDKSHVSSLMKNLEVEKKLQVKLESTQDEIDTNESKEHQKKKIKHKLYNASEMIMKNKKKLEKV